jgi:hypothetical protein
MLEFARSIVNNSPLVKVNAKTAAEICAQFYLPRETRQQLQGKMTPREFVETLMENGRYLEGIDFVAHALAAREAIWWGCLCLQHACGDSLSPTEKAACRAAVRWVLQPTEENRAAAKAPADRAGPTNPAGALAAGANQTGGSVAPANAPRMPPGPFAPAKAVAMAVKLASNMGDPIKMADRHELFVRLGIGVAEGRFLWPEIRNGASIRK